MSITRTPACTVKFCPAPRDPDWHQCFVCGGLEIHHHDAGAKGMGGGKDHHKRPENVIALCHDHHQAVTLNECSDRIFDELPGRPYVYYGVRGNILHERLLGGSDAGTGSDLRGPGDVPVGLVGNSGAPTGVPEAEAQPVEGPIGGRPLEAGSAAAEAKDSSRVEYRPDRPGVVGSNPASSSAAAPSASGESDEKEGEGNDDTAKEVRGRSSGSKSGGESAGAARLPKHGRRHKESGLLARGDGNRVPREAVASGESGTGEGDYSLAAPVGGYAGARPSPVPLSPEAWNLETWKEQGAGLLEMEETIWSAAQAIQFAVGDWFLSGEQHLAEEIYGHIDTIRSPSGKTFKIGTLMQQIWVAKNVAPNTRALAPSWTHCRHVAHLPEPEQKEWLDKARRGNLTSKDLSRAIHGEKPKVRRWTIEELRELVGPFTAWWASPLAAHEIEAPDDVLQFLDWLEAPAEEAK